MIDLETFEILPRSTTCPMHPGSLPREIFVRDDNEVSSLQAQAALVASKPNKSGRPSKRDKVKKAKDALNILERHMDRHAQLDPAFPIPFDSEVDFSALPNNPNNSRATYRALKSDLLHSIDPANDLDGDVNMEATATTGQAALVRANHAVLARLRRIDQMAAEKGLEIGGEGGDRTGLGRVERAVGQLDSELAASHLNTRGGLLSLIEGGGMPEQSNQDNDDE